MIWESGTGPSALCITKINLWAMQWERLSSARKQLWINTSRKILLWGAWNKEKKRASIRNPSLHRYIQFLFCISARFAIPSDHASPIGFCRPPHLRARLYYHIFTRKPAFPVVQVVTRRSAIRHHTHLFVSKPHAATASAMRLLLLAPSPDLLCGPAAMNLIILSPPRIFPNCKLSI